MQDNKNSTAETERPVAEAALTSVTRKQPAYKQNNEKWNTQVKQP